MHIYHSQIELTINKEFIKILILEIYKHKCNSSFIPLRQDNEMNYICTFDENHRAYKALE